MLVNGAPGRVRAAELQAREPPTSAGPPLFTATFPGLVDWWFAILPREHGLEPKTMSNFPSALFPFFLADPTLLAANSDPPPIRCDIVTVCCKPIERGPRAIKGHTADKVGAVAPSAAISRPWLLSTRRYLRGVAHTPSLRRLLPHLK